MQEFNAINQIKTQLSAKRISAIKLNYNIDPSLQRYSQYYGYLEFDSECRELFIYNKKLKESSILDGLRS